MDVVQTLMDIADTYDNASWFRKFNARNAMFGVLSFSSWDILSPILLPKPKSHY